MSSSIGRIRGGQPGYVQPDDQSDVSQVQQQLTTALTQLLQNSTTLSPTEAQQLQELLTQSQGSTPLSSDQQQQLAQLLTQAIGTNGMQQLANIVAQASGGTNSASGTSSGTTDGTQTQGVGRKHHHHHHKAPALDTQDQATASSIKSQLKNSSLSSDDRQALIQQLHSLYQNANPVSATQLDGLQDPNSANNNVSPLTNGIGQS
jgi:hypothetical protein